MEACLCGSLYSTLTTSFYPYMHFIKKNRFQTLFKYQLDRSKPTCSFKAWMYLVNNQLLQYCPMQWLYWSEVNTQIGFQRLKTCSVTQFMASFCLATSRYANPGAINTIFQKSCSSSLIYTKACPKPCNIHVTTVSSLRNSNVSSPLWLRKAFYQTCKVWVAVWLPKLTIYLN